MQGVSGIVLAGGRGRRMGGVDKGLQELRGRPMMAWVLERLAPQVSEIIVNANQNLEAYARFGHRVVPDAIGGYAGPLAGLKVVEVSFDDEADAFRNINTREELKDA